MPRDTEKILIRLAAQMFTLPIEDYLLSEKFSVFCRKHDLCDVWNEYLALSRDKPDLYGSAVTKYAFVLFLHHIFHSRQDEFLKLFGLFLADFSQELSCKVPFDDLKKELMKLGYPEIGTENAFSTVKSMKP